MRSRAHSAVYCHVVVCPYRHSCLCSQYSWVNIEPHGTGRVVEEAKGAGGCAQHYSCISIIVE